MSTARYHIPRDARLDAVVRAYQRPDTIREKKTSEVLHGLILDGLKYRAIFEAWDVPEGIEAEIEALIKPHLKREVEIERRARALRRGPERAEVIDPDPSRSEVIRSDHECADPITPEPEGHPEPYNESRVHAQARDLDPDPDPITEEIEDLDQGSRSAPSHPAGSAEEGVSLATDTDWCIAQWNALVRDVAAGDEVFSARHAWKGASCHLDDYVRHRRELEGQGFRRRFVLALELTRVNDCMWGRVDPRLELSLPGLLGSMWERILTHKAAPYRSREGAYRAYKLGVDALRRTRPELFAGETEAQAVPEPPRPVAARPVADPAAQAVWAPVQELVRRAEGIDEALRLWTMQAVPVGLSGGRVRLDAVEHARAFVVGHLDAIDEVARAAGLEGVAWAAA